MGGIGGGLLISLDGVAPTRIVSVSASCYPPLHHKVQKKLSSGIGLPRWSREKGRKTVVVMVIVSDLCVHKVEDSDETSQSHTMMVHYEPDLLKRIPAPVINLLLTPPPSLQGKYLTVRVLLADFSRCNDML